MRVPGPPAGQLALSLRSSPGIRHALCVFCLFWSSSSSRLFPPFFSSHSQTQGQVFVCVSFVLRRLSFLLRPSPASSNASCQQRTGVPPYSYAIGQVLSFYQACVMHCVSMWQTPPPEWFYSSAAGQDGGQLLPM